MAFPVVMEVSPVEMACAVSKSADSASGRELQLNTADLQPAGEIEMSNKGSARLQLDPEEFSSSDRAAGQRQVAADPPRSNCSIGIRPPGVQLVWEPSRSLIRNRCGHRMVKQRHLWQNWARRLARSFGSARVVSFWREGSWY